MIIVPADRVKDMDESFKIQTTDCPPYDTAKMVTCAPTAILRAAISALMPQTKTEFDLNESSFQTVYIYVCMQVCARAHEREREREGEREKDRGREREIEKERVIREREREREN
jgi:hypothetical protein